MMPRYSIIMFKHLLTSLFLIFSYNSYCTKTVKYFSHKINYVLLISQLGFKCILIGNSKN